MLLNYRNKSVFGLNSIIDDNKISSNISILLANLIVQFKKQYNLDYIQNVIIRNDQQQVLITIDAKEKFIPFDIQNELIKNLLEMCSVQNYNVVSVGYQILLKNNCVIIYGKSNMFFNLVVNKTDYRFYIGHHNYFQINNYEIPTLYEYIYVLCQTINSSTKEFKNISFVCIGDDSGNISIVLSKLYHNLNVHIPCKYSYDAAIHNISNNDITNINLYNNGKIYSDVIDNNECILLINPGRKGLSNVNIDFINNHFNIKHLIYMSCKPSTLNTNITKINIKVSSIRYFNMFPNTKDYVESVSHFER